MLKIWLFFFEGVGGGVGGYYGTNENFTLQRLKFLVNLIALKI